MIAVVDELIPEGVELIDVIVVLEWEEVSTFVTVRELRVVAVLTVEGLDEVTHIVDEEAEGVRFGDVLIVIELVHQVGVHGASLVICALFARKPGDNTVKSHSKIARVFDDIVVTLLALIDIWEVNEVVVTLPPFAVVLEIVGERGALNEGVLVLVRGHVGVRILQIGQHLIRSRKRVRSILLQEVLGDVCNYRIIVVSK